MAIAVSFYMTRLVGNTIVVLQFTHPFLCLIFTGTNFDNVKFSRYDVKVLHPRHICNP